MIHPRGPAEEENDLPRGGRVFWGRAATSLPFTALVRAYHPPMPCHP